MKMLAISRGSCGPRFGAYEVGRRIPCGTAPRPLGFIGREASRL